MSVNLVKHIQGAKSGFSWWLINSVISSIPSKHLRRGCLRSLGMKIDKNVQIFQGFHMRNIKGITIEDGVSVGPNVLLDGCKGLVIRKSAVIAYDAIIWTLNHDYNDLHFCGKGAPVEIGAYSWICCRSIILPGVKVGEGAVVASGAVVTKDVPPYSIVAGVPARVIGNREKKQYDYGYAVNDDFAHFA